MAMDPRIDAYIARQADFARPILDHIRALMHAASPDIGEACLLYTSPSPRD